MDGLPSQRGAISSPADEKEISPEVRKEKRQGARANARPLPLFSAPPKMCLKAIDIQYLARKIRKYPQYFVGIFLGGDNWNRTSDPMHVKHVL